MRVRRRPLGARHARRRQRHATRTRCTAKSVTGCDRSASSKPRSPPRRSWSRPSTSSTLLRVARSGHGTSSRAPPRPAVRLSPEPIPRRASRSGLPHVGARSYSAICLWRSPASAARPPRFPAVDAGVVRPDRLEKGACHVVVSFIRRGWRAPRRSPSCWLPACRPRPAGHHDQRHADRQRDPQAHRRTPSWSSKNCGAR